MKDLSYYRRIFQAYLGRGNSQLSFWHGTPILNEKAFLSDSNQFYMAFRDKAHYAGPFDEEGIPMLDYRGRLGRHYNPIAVAQYGLGCLNLWDDCIGQKAECKGERPEEWRRRWEGTADWLVENLEENEKGFYVWMHKFDWEYAQLLKAPWFSGLAQGQGVSLLVRAYQVTGDTRYSVAADKAMNSLMADMADGGTTCVDDNGDIWIEEYLTDPPSHILNGFIWALWGVYDYLKLTERRDVKDLWEKSLRTLHRNLCRYDYGYWSLYDLSHVRRKNLASPFYHTLHLVQLAIMNRLAPNAIFHDYHQRWQQYQSHACYRGSALIKKALFKLLYF